MEAGLGLSAAAAYASGAFVESHRERLRETGRVPKDVDREFVAAFAVCAGICSLAATKTTSILRFQRGDLAVPLPCQRPRRRRNVRGLRLLLKGSERTQTSRPCGVSMEVLTEFERLRWRRGQRTWLI